MSKFKNIIWDMDGTLLDALDDLADSVNAALAAYRLPLRTREEIRSFVGNGILRLIELSVPNGKDYIYFDEVFSFFKEHYLKNCQNKTKPYDGIKQVLKDFKEQGYQMAIVSNKVDSAVKYLVELYFKDTIHIAIGESEGVRKKPSPDMVIEAMRLMNADKRSTVYVGDSEVDIATAKNSGIAGISVSWGYRHKAELVKNGASIIVDTPKLLAEYINSEEI